MSEANKAVVRRWFAEVWNQGRESTIEELFPATGVARGLGESDTDVHGPAEFHTFAAVMRGSLPDFTSGSKMESLKAIGWRCGSRSKGHTRAGALAWRRAGGAFACRASSFFVWSTARSWRRGTATISLASFGSWVRCQARATGTHSGCKRRLGLLLRRHQCLSWRQAQVRCRRTKTDRLAFILDQRRDVLAMAPVVRQRKRVDRCRTQR